MVSGELIDPRQKLGGSLLGQLHYGLPGKSAYQYAVEAGYTGTEEEFAKKLASEYSGDVDPEEIKKIVDEYLEENPPSGGNVDLTGYATEDWVKKGYQPKGEYLTRVPEGYAKMSDIPKKPEDIGAQPAGNYALRSELPTVPTKVSAFANDAGYLTQHQDISGKLDADKLPEAVNEALAQAKESGKFDGKDGYSPVRGEDYWTTEDVQNMVTYAVNGVLAQKSTILEVAYPVGAIYMSTVSTSPKTLFGFGTWERIQDRFLLAAGSTYSDGSTGGSPTHKHVYGLKVYEYYSTAAFNPKGGLTGAINIDDGTLGSWVGGSSMAGAENLNSSLGTTTASANPHHYESRANTSTANNMPPYLAVYVWKRTA